MFSVLFEVNPHADQWDSYLDYAKMLRPDLEQIDGFIDNIRYGSLTRNGWILSLSNWRDEKALVRWRTRARHHDVQSKGREHVLADYHLRVGQITHDNQLPDGSVLAEQRLDETQVGEGSTAILVDRHRDTDTGPDTDGGSDNDGGSRADAEQLAAWLGLDPQAPGLLAWDVFEAVLSPGDFILLMSWRDHHAADGYRHAAANDADMRLRQIRIVRDYGMYDRRENPQYYPDVARPE